MSYEWELIDCRMTGEPVPETTPLRQPKSRTAKRKSPRAVCTLCKKEVAVTRARTYWHHGKWEKTPIW